jgi:hypothetical protein
MKIVINSHANSNIALQHLLEGSKKLISYVYCNI